jgi:hypothetical protein
LFVKLFYDPSYFRVNLALTSFLCPIGKDGKKLLVDGGGAWKSLTVTDSSGNVIVTKKFTKKDFDKVVSDPVLGKYVDDMMEAAYVKLPSKSEQDEVLNDSGEEGDDTE